MMVAREPGELKRLGDLLGETYAGLAGETSGDREPGGADDGRATPERPGASRRSPGAPTGSRGGSPVEPERLLALLWPEVVGAEVAANAQPVQLRHKRLVVSSASSAWSQTLHFMGPAIKAAINERLGGPIVEEIVFRHAGWKAEGAGAPGRGGTHPAPAPLTAEQEAALAEVEKLALSPELRDRILGAMRAAFLRGEQ